jgi:uncharacterized protein YndB with AHSA1/START domain
METERITASTTIEADPKAVFAVLADPSAHSRRPARRERR